MITQIPNIETAVPGTVHAWHDVPSHFAGRELPPGPWRDEPNKMQWVDSATQLPCLIVRSGLGALCGYAGVFEGHPLFGKDCDDADADFDVHGGLTFAAKCAHGAKESEGVCHVPEPGSPDNVWWFGFDCAHLGDLCPLIPLLEETRNESWILLSGGPFNESYKNVPYVVAEVTSLALQLHALQAAS